MADPTKGLYCKYIVERVDNQDRPGRKHHGCDYFVLDLSHDKFAEPAIRSYAAACASELPALSADLEAKAKGMREAGIQPETMHTQVDMGFGMFAVGGCKYPDNHAVPGLIYFRLPERLEFDTDCSDIFPVGSTAKIEDIAALIYFHTPETLQQTIDALLEIQAEHYPKPAPNLRLPFAILEHELNDLRRFHECAMDGEGYDVPKERMHHLAEIGLVRRSSGNYYETTVFGTSVLNGDFDTALPTFERPQNGGAA